MSKFIFIISTILIVFSVVMFVSDFLPADMFVDSGNDTYLKSVPSDSFSWAQYKVHLLVIGLALLGLSKFTNLFSSQ